ncbi:MULTISPECIES: SDR family NAD(P)-dependent oxidoreductase [Streptomyces]|uniref:SDR family NAD(P)-dependent oxidoreductase n=1 Tax=Streptomyces TaxID=1883 RepID=UPI00163CFBB2|nr:MULTISPECIES: SDR family NAD(P)-dependent oxidoreductase [Streptomyces]MBC2876076.1 SDR family oxidoreductase [Streptomyces sp. TYQ1024]UBI38435.1 SDR family oxidoreductase [Streptomyces mobaraensis]UKW31020.1 SDR family oxidoreductase [Streptomyces sp. TYQ1024]
MTRRFDGWSVLITGAGRGIGAATALRLAGEGARVLVTDADGDRAERTAHAIREAGLIAEAHICDVTDREAVEAAVAHAADRFGGLDVLVNNALSCGRDPEHFEDHSDELWQRDLDVTLGGAFRCSRAALPHLAAAGGRGAIVNIGSVNGEQDFGNHAYSAAKAGLASLTRTLAGEAAARGVRVNLIAPGTVHTPNWDGREDALRRAAAHYPLGRVGRPEDVAAAVAFLASRDASWITGVTLPVDGGILVANVGLRGALRGR